MSNLERASESHIPAIDGAVFGELAVSAYVAIASDECHDEFPEGPDHNHLAKAVPELQRQLSKRTTNPLRCYSH